MLKDKPALYFRVKWVHHPSEKGSLMIPKTIRKEHIIEAARLIDSSPVPKHREAKRYEVTVNGRNYPPKYLISIVSQIVTEHHLKPDEFGGGDEANGFLRRLGFAVRRIADLAVVARPHRQHGVKIARAWLDIGITMKEFSQRRDKVRKSLKHYPEEIRKKEKGEAFKQVVESRFQVDKRGHYERLRLLSREAKRQGADILVLPACAMMYKGKFNPCKILGDDMPDIVASGRLRVGEHSGPLLAGEDSIILMDGQLFNIDEAVLWIGPDEKPFSIIATVSSTIKHVRKGRWILRPPLPGRWVLPRKAEYVPNAGAKAPTMRPRKNDPVLLLDMGHNRYTARYLHNTLRTVWESQGNSRRAVVVLSSWHYKNANYEPSWTWPLAWNSPLGTSKRAKKVKYVKWTKGIWSQHGDVIDMIEVDLSQARRPHSKSTN
jgi:hypothetical protein